MTPALSRHADSYSIPDEDTPLLSTAKQSRSATPDPQNPRIFAYVPSNASLTLENTGSVARDHLALERTFLAYMRTCLAIASSGVALVQLFTVSSSGIPQGLYAPSLPAIRVYVRPLGAVMVTFGLFVLGVGISRYLEVQAALVKGKFPVARWSLGVMSVVLGLLVAITFGVLASGTLDSGGDL